MTYSIERRDSYGAWHTVSIAYSMPQAKQRLARLLEDHPERAAANYRITEGD